MKSVYLLIDPTCGIVRGVFASEKAAREDMENWDVPMGIREVEVHDSTVALLSGREWIADYILVTRNAIIDKIKYEAVETRNTTRLLSKEHGALVLSSLVIGTLSLLCSIATLFVVLRGR